MAWERDLGAHQWAPVCGGVGGALQGGTGRDASAALAGDLVAGGGADDAGGGRRAGVHAALGRGAGRALQRARPRGPGRPAAAQRTGGERTDPGGAGGALRAAARPARGWRPLDWRQGRSLDGGPARRGAGAPTARLGGAEADPMVDPSAAPAAPALGHARAKGCVQGGLDRAVAQARGACCRASIRPGARCTTTSEPGATPAPGCACTGPCTRRRASPPGARRAPRSSSWTGSP